MRPFTVLASLLLVLPLVGRCAAADPPAPEERVKVTVAVILANGGDKVDGRLTCLAREIHELHPRLTGFRLGPMTTQSVPLGGAETFRLVDGQVATIAVKRCTERPGCFCLDVKSKALVGEMTYSSVCGKYFPLVTEYKTKKEGDQLIIAFMVESCAGKEKEKGKK
jgi:hypothetical protein